MQTFVTLLLAVRLLTGQTITDTGAMAFTCHAYNGDLSQYVTVTSTPLGSMAAVSVPVGHDYALLCQSTAAWYAPVWIEGHDPSPALIYLDSTTADSVRVLASSQRFVRPPVALSQGPRARMCSDALTGIALRPLCAWRPLSYEYFPELSQHTYWLNLPTGFVVTDVAAK